MSKKPLVSVLMPVFNGEAYLGEAIESVLAQTFKDFELLVINDGSTDRTQNIIDRYSDPRMRCISQSNAGVANALNRGLAEAQGVYIWRHDADDICLPEQLETQLTFLESHKDYVLVGTQIAFMTDRGKIAHRFRQPKNRFFNAKPYIEVKRAHFNPYSPITHATVLMKTQVVRSLGGYRPEFKTSEDTDLWLRLIEIYRAAVLNYCSYYVRINSTSATKIYKKTTTFYRDLAFAFADQRFRGEKDVLQRGESMPIPLADTIPTAVKRPRKGSHFRSDILDFKYKVAVDAKDFRNIKKSIVFALKDGWRLSQTWRALIFPILGQNFVQMMVNLKQKLS